MAKYAKLNEAMVAKDDLAEAELRYQLLAETFEAAPTLRANLNSSLERAKAEILRLRALASPTSGLGHPDSGKVVAFDPDRFRKSEDRKAGGSG